MYCLVSLEGATLTFVKICVYSSVGTSCQLYATLAVFRAVHTIGALTGTEISLRVGATRWLPLYAKNYDIQHM